MPAATILFLDIVGFSKNPNSRQRELVDSLTSEVTSGLSSLVNQPQVTPHFVAIPTGDGMALAFLHRPDQPWGISTIMSMIHRVGSWAKSQETPLRTGVHAGEVELITDINGKTNILGDTINYAQRVMDAANPKQVLFSDTAFRQYIGSNSPSYSGPPYSSGCKAVFEGPFDVQAKHGMRMLVYKMILEPPQDWLSNDDPGSKLTLNPPIEPLSRSAALTRTGPAARRRRQIFVGRERELKQLKTLYEKTTSGQGTLVTIEGGPGIGKSALCEKLAAYARARGGHVLVGHCEESSIPYLPFVEAIRSYVLATGVNDIKKGTGISTAYLARIVPELNDKLKIELPASGDPQEERYRLLQAVSDFLTTNATAAEPMLVILEDLHDADRGTLQALVQLARGSAKSSLLVVGTFRDTEIGLNQPLSETLTDVRRLSNCQRIKLGELNAEEVRRMVGALTRQKVSEELASAMHKKTEGNPLFINEVVRYLAERGLNGGEDNTLTITEQMIRETGVPEEVRGVMSKRLSKLSPECNRILSVAAVIGREFRLELLRRLTEIPETELFSALREARAAAVLEEFVRMGANVTYRFSHDFFRETIYEDLIAPECINIHHQVAQAIESVYVGHLEEHAVELTEHFSHSSNAEDLAKAVTYGEMAAKQSQDVYAHGQTVRLLEHTLKVQEVLDASDRAKCCDLLLALGDALINDGEPRRILDVEAPRAWSLAQAMNDATRSSGVCHLAMLALFYYGIGDAWMTPDASMWAERAERSAQPNTIARARADTATGIVKCAKGYLSEGVPFLTRAMETARDRGDSDTHWWAAAMWLLYASGFKHDDDALSIVEHLAASSREGISTGVLIWALVMMSDTFLDHARRAQAEGIWREAHDLIDRNGQARYQAFSMAGEALFDTLDGNLEKAVNTINRLKENGGELGFAELAHVQVFTVGMRPLLYLGKIEDALGYFATVVLPKAKALCLAHHGQIAEATDILEECLAPRYSNQYVETNDETPVYGDVMLLETAVMVGHAKAADLLLRHLDKYKSRTTGIFHATCLDRHLGAAASLLGRYDEARGYYRRALGISSGMRFRPEIALTRLQIAELVLEHYPEERDQAVDHLDFAIDEFQDMKMKPSLERALQIKRFLNTTEQA